MIRLIFWDYVKCLDARLRRFSLGLAGVAVTAAIIGFLLRGAALTGDIAGMVDREMLGLLWGTSVGEAFTYRLAGIIVISIGLYLPVIGAWVSLAGGLIALWSFTQIGHIPDQEQTGIRLLLLLHLLGVSFWVGILAPLRWLARDPEYLAVAANFGDKFGVMASGIVAVLVLAGGLMAWLILGTLSLIFTTAYGLALVGKVTLVALLLGLAAANKLRFIPAMQAGNQKAAAHLARSIELEITVITAVLVATATLTSVLALPM
ncbi:copper resistance D family protein [Parasedimentitalea psychrophila]|uniref:CopD family protein n=2 Tax=Parasedimentitalea psychrophila TaxID=2997337 RepID=A0A9Y2P1G1_9RHOB|nr:CopD family protein [Parasedimentitalea psychrophila]WIY24077.1 CopD family protein [Parasedimentitalea psychrophila]